MKALAVQQEAEDAIEGDRMWRLVDGYSGLVDYLKERVAGTVVLGAKVVRVGWKDEDREQGGHRERATEKGILVSIEDGTRFSADVCVVTVPLGVLQAGVVHLPDEAAGILEAAGRMRMGLVCRFTMIFKERLWPEAMSFVLSRASVPGVWWTARPHESRTLTGWVGGPRAKELLILSEAELRERAIASAAEGAGNE